MMLEFCNDFDDFAPLKVEKGLHKTEFWVEY